MLALAKLLGMDSATYEGSNIRFVVINFRSCFTFTDPGEKMKSPSLAAPRRIRVSIQWLNPLRSSFSRRSFRRERAKTCRQLFRQWWLTANDWRRRTVDTIIMQAAHGKDYFKIGAEGVYVALPCERWKKRFGGALKSKMATISAPAVVNIELLRAATY